MAVFQRDYKDGKTKTWTVKYYEPTPDGKRRQRWKGGFRTKRDALAFEVSVKDQINKRTYTRPTKMLFGDFIRDEWLPGVKVSRRPTTFETYSYICRVHIIPRLGGWEVAALTPGAIDAMYATLLASGLSAKTVKNVHGVVHKILTVARKRGVVGRNVADDATPPSAEPHEMEFWTPDEMRAFLQATSEDRMAAAWRLALATGFRRGELLGLRWTDLDLDAGKVSVRQARVRAGNAVVTGPPKTERSRRTIGLDAGTILALRSWRKRQVEERLAGGQHWTDSGYVFTMPDGRPVAPNRFSIWYRAAVRRAGLRPIPLHSLRHTYVTVARASGTPLHNISRRVGHANDSITANIYAHVIPQEDDAAAETIGAVLDSAVAER
jgi:integrase